MIGLVLCASVALADESLPFRQPMPGGYSLAAKNLAVIINEADADSREVGDYYAKVRHIPQANIIRVTLPLHREKLTAKEFEAFKAVVEARLGADIQALLMVWKMPYAVECNAITAAMTLGFDAAQCKNTCAPGKMSNYFDHPSRQSYTDLGYRISMLLPVEADEAAKALIDRGVMSDYSAPTATGYFLITSDSNRNSRSRFFPPSGFLAPRYLSIKTLQADSIENERDIMFYQTGLASVPKLDTLTFLPGALADHLTSFGGRLNGSGQMSSLKWLDAGATASYGTVSEPCNHWQKFPNSAVLLKHYLNGASAIEAYWKSVAWPAQGLFVGEPLAAPYRR
jgi:uncharacterized protein (TIGR03790 family)